MSRLGGDRGVGLEYVSGDGLGLGQVRLRNGDCWGSSLGYMSGDVLGLGQYYA